MNNGFKSKTKIMAQNQVKWKKQGLIQRPKCNSKALSKDKASESVIVIVVNRESPIQHATVHYITIVTDWRKLVTFCGTLQ